MRRAIPLLILLTACGSTVKGVGSDPEDAGSDNETDGMSFAGAAGEAGAGGESGTENDAGFAGGSVGGSAGDSGSGGEAGMTTAGTGGGPCVPKNCATVAVELNKGPGGNPEACELVSDGCGNFIDCEGCTKPDTFCGKTAPSDGSGPEPKGTANLCGGGCTKQTTHAVCETDFPGTQFYICTENSINPPFSSCISSPLINNNMWCCP
jgi:predicted small secreted protein